MLRNLLLPLLLFTLSMACMGQTFQYSRGWTNGKRAPTAAALSSGSGDSSSHYHRDFEHLTDLYELSDNERKLDRCLVQLQRFVGSALLHRGSLPYALSYNAQKNNNNNNNYNANTNNNNNNNDNSPFSNHHQSSELFEELNSAVVGVASAEPNDYGKH